MKVKIHALDTLTFGVGKPSVWGEDSFSTGMFPPFPSVIRGAMRTSWLYENGSLDIANTDDDPTQKYTISEYALLLDEIPHFPVPADIVWSEENKTLIPCLLQKNDGLSSLKTPYQLGIDVDGKISPAEQRYLSRTDLEKYLNGESVTVSVPLKDKSAHLEDQILLSESRIGIYRSRDTNTAKEHMLYRSPLLRLNHAALVARIEGAECGGLIRFGGKGKIADFTSFDGAISPCGGVSEDGKFKIYLATPAIFRERCMSESAPLSGRCEPEETVLLSSGCEPEESASHASGCEPESVSPSCGYLPELPVEARLLTAAIYGYDCIGGYDMKAGHPKPMRRAVKAGSVYYYELAENSAKNRAAIQALHGQSISDFSREDGLGICYIGKIQEDKGDV